MNEQCSQCGTRFRREPGYFLGAMVLSYFASSGIGIACMLVLFLSDQMEIVPAAATAVGVVALLTPLLTRLAKIVWIRIDHRADPEKTINPRPNKTLDSKNSL